MEFLNIDLIIFIIGVLFILFIFVKDILEFLLNLLFFFESCIIVLLIC